VNGVDLSYANCDGNPINHFALFANFGEKKPTNAFFEDNWAYCHSLFAPLKSNPSTRLMPTAYFTFMETGWGGCACYTQTDGRASIVGIINAAIGFR